MGELELPKVNFPVASSFRCTLGLKTILFTMAKAGCYTVVEDGKEVVFAPLTPLLGHLAAAENYALKHSLKDEYTQQNILETMVQVDEAIRGEWCKTMREEPFPSLGKATEIHKPFAAAMWLTRPAKNAKGQGGKAGAKRSQATQQHQIAPSNDTGPKDAGKRQTGKGKQGGRAPPSSGDAQPKIAAKNKDGKPFCRFRNTTECTNAACWFEHSCDVTLLSGKACGGNRARNDHYGLYMAA